MLLREREAGRPAPAHVVRESPQEARKETVEDVKSDKCPNAGSFRLGLSIMYEAVFLVSWSRPFCRRYCVERRCLGGR